MQKFAYFDTGHEFPEEIIMAAGFTPYKILGDVHVGTAAADDFLFQYLCPFARGCLTEALRDSEQWAGIGFAHGCDATNRQFDIWKAHVQPTFLHWLDVPMKINRTAQLFYQKELNRFIEALNRQFKTSISPDQIKDAISLSNKIKVTMKQLAALRATRDIPNPDYFAMTRMAVQSPKKTLLPELEKLLTDWESRAPFPADKTPILLTGSNVTYKEWMEVLETAGFRVVRDDLSLGERYFNTTIHDFSDPIAALVDYNCRIPQPATRVPSDNRMKYLLQALSETAVKGVILQTLKFCEPYALDAPWVIETFKNNGYKVIQLEREFTPTLDHQTITRLETFKELL
jgi:benzoyl-CoA reductase/2-hydroxyglutaryl-CoA dehydratase subunit BcrC/BadD/HgdB